VDKNSDGVNISMIHTKINNKSGEFQPFLYDLIIKYTYTQQLSSFDIVPSI